MAGTRKYLARPNMAKKLDAIYDIWQEHSINGHFIRHIDGKRQHNSIYNLALIHPYDAFANIDDSSCDDWVVDWDTHLTSTQIEFVRQHIRYFVNRYDNPEFWSSLKGKAQITKPDNESEDVPVHETDKYKEFIAQTWNQICEHSPEMRNADNEYLFADL